MRLDDTGRVVGFLEKPKTEQELEHVRTDPAWIDARGIASRGRDCLANMGIYLFNRNTLIDVLQKTDYRDFGKEVFPASIRSRHVQVHLFDGYWEDIGTIKSFYEANLELAKPDAPFDLASAEAPIYLARPVPAADALRRRHGPRQPGGRRLDDRGGRGDREQRDRPALPHRPQRVDPQFDPDGHRLLRNARRDRRPPGQRQAAAGRRRGLASSKGRSSTRTAASAATCGSSTNRALEHTDETPFGMIRDGIVVMPKGTTLPDGWTL